MKKLVFCAVLAAGSVALYSFKGVDEVKDFNENQLETTSKEFKNFHRSAEVFSDKFTRWREEWVDYANLQKMEASLDKMNETLEKF
ncbi:hypothetical protein GO491_04390 [Flavobacteriaceae bacterium Ap0902]|nr:hypothetical protein [Flavobacteriaceae bacterium Ap0902]